MHSKAAASGKGHFGDLTDDLLRHVLSFLPAAHALQTCVLDTRWRDHWRRTTSLLLIFDQSSFPSPERFKQLVKLFIHLRGNSPLDKCKIVACVDDEEERKYTNTMLLIEYALKCQVKELLLSVAVEEDNHAIEYDPLILNVPLISHHLKVLHLKRVDLKLSALNFSRCSVLEDLEMQHCNIDARRISSKSLKRLCITDYCSFPVEFHIRIFAPGLISLLLDFHNGLTPSLEHMPSLETADVWLGHACYHSCRSNRQDCEYDECSCHAYPVEEGVLLHGLSNAVNLKLIAGSNTEVCIYRWDLECCPIFDKLKTLSLNEWFTTIDLLCILQHSPVLEMLTLWLGSTKKFVRATGAEEKIEQSFVCSHLKVVNIDCDKVDEGVHKILKFLSTCGILRDQISLMEHCITHTFTYDWDLEWCPIFGKLKTLLLNDWWAIDQLVCILQHSPNLEMLTLHLENTEELVSATGGQEAIEQPFVCAHLKVVNIECRKVDEGICKIWKILTRSGILHEQISIKDGCFPPSDSNIEALELWEPRRPCPPLMARWMCAQS